MLIGLYPSKLGIDCQLKTSKRRISQIRSNSPLGIIYNYNFEALEKLVKELNLEGKPGQIFNCDETSFCHGPNKIKVFDVIGMKSSQKTSSAGQKTHLFCCVALLNVT